MSNQYPNDRRQFSRIVFDGETLLRQGAQQWSVTLVDVSLKGLLIETPANWQADLDTPFTAEIHLNGETAIVMTVRWRHSEDSRGDSNPAEARHSGFECAHIDIDSITHLRRLVELNLGDVSLLERELAVLGS